MKFHWFLPTNAGDGRQVVSGGHGVGHGAAGRRASVACLGQIAHSAEELGEIHPFLWAGVGVVRGGAGTAIVGSHEDVAGRASVPFGGQRAAS